MGEEIMEDRRINWLSLFIKIIIAFILVLIVIWLVSKFTNKKENDKLFKKNLEAMEKVSIDYFKSIDLPLKNGESTKITLEEMISQNLIVSVKSEDGTTCNGKNSYAKIIRKDKNYLVEVTLECGKNKDTKKSTISFKDCKNCEINTSNNTNNVGNSNNNTNGEENNSANNSSNNNSAPSTTYYEHVKETTTYSKWMRGAITGDNIENKYEYYSTASETYYSTYYLKEESLKKNKEISYVLKLNNVPNPKYYFTTVKESNYFDPSEESKYLNSNNVSVYKSTLDIDTNSISNYSLKDDNFEYKLNPYYRSGNFYVRVTITIKNTDGIKSYYDSNSKSKVYFIPLKLSVKFASNEIVTSVPSGEYETISYYRYIEKNREILWSTEDYLEGYTKTGNTKLA